MQTQSYSEGESQTLYVKYHLPRTRILGFITYISSWTFHGIGCFFEELSHRIDKEFLDGLLIPCYQYFMGLSHSIQGDSSNGPWGPTISLNSIYDTQTFGSSSIACSTWNFKV